MHTLRDRIAQALEHRKAIADRGERVPVTRLRMRVPAGDLSVILMRQIPLPGV